MLTNLYAFRTVPAFFAVGFFLVTVGALRVSADSTTFTINAPNSDLATDMGPYATVKIDLTSGNTMATVTVDSLTNGGNLYRMGSNGAVDLNVNGDYSLGTVTETGTAGLFTPTFKVNDPGGTGDGFGKFTLSLDNMDGFGDSATEISFTLTKASGTWSSATNVLIPNDKNNSVALDLFACATSTTPPKSCTSTQVSPDQGFATVAPEPASMLLFGTGLLAIGTVVRRRRLTAA
jgi:hypothetical protein